MCQGLEEQQTPLQLPEPKGPGPVVSDPWVLIAHCKRTLKGWRLLCEQIQENAQRCYDWLRADPTRRIPGRCYELKHKHYIGVWCYEVGSGQRVYYKPRRESHDVLVYYAGPHPTKVPYPPK